MAVSGSISIKQNSQNIAKNTSSITVTGKATMSGPSYDLYTRTGTLTIDGKSYKFSATFPSNSTKTLFSKTVTITHNSVGEKTVSASFRIKTGMTGTLPNGVISESTSKKLTKIPRTSKVSMSDKNFNIGASITINTNRASSSFTHKLVIKFNGKTVRTQTNVGASYKWSTTELYKYIPNANSATGTITCTTYSGSTTIGTSSVSFTANVKNSNPTFSNGFQIEDTNATTLALTGNKSKFIRRYSSAKVTIPVAQKMTAKNSATSKAYNIIIGSKSHTVSYSSTNNVSYTFNNIDSNTVNVYAIDSRNNQTKASKSINAISYTEILLQSVTVNRENGIGTNVIVTANGKYHNINFGAVTNSIKNIEFRKKKSTLSTWDAWQSIKYLFDIDTTAGTFKTNPRLLSPELDGFQLGVEYDVQIRVTDELSSDVEDIRVNSGKVLMSAIKDIGVCFGGIYSNSKGGGFQLKVGQNYFNENDLTKEDDSGWKTATLSSNFKPYNNDSVNTPQYRKIGKMVEVRGIISPTKTIVGGSTTIPIFYLPEGFKPHKNVYSICQGTGINRWLLSVAEGGSVNFARYGTNDWKDADTSVWLPFTICFFAGD